MVTALYPGTGLHICICLFLIIHFSYFIFNFKSFFVFHYLLCKFLFSNFSKSTLNLAWTWFTYIRISTGSVLSQSIWLLNLQEILVNFLSSTVIKWKLATTACKFYYCFISFIIQLIHLYLENINSTIPILKSQFSYPLFDLFSKSFLVPLMCDLVI